MTTQTPPFALDICLVNPDLPLNLHPIGYGYAANEAQALAFLQQPSGKPKLKRGQILTATRTSTGEVWRFSFVVAGAPHAKMTLATEASVQMPSKLRRATQSMRPSNAHYEDHPSDWYSSLQYCGLVLWVGVAVGVDPDRVARAVVALWQQVLTDVPTDLPFAVESLAMARAWSEDHTQKIPRARWDELQGAVRKAIKDGEQPTATWARAADELMQVMSTAVALASRCGGPWVNDWCYEFVSALESTALLDSSIDSLYGTRSRQHLYDLLRQYIRPVDVLLAIKTKASDRYRAPVSAK